MPERVGVEPYVAHATFQFSGTPGKRNRFRERLLWTADPPSYFAPAPGYVAVVSRAPRALLSAAGAAPRDGALASTAPHFALVNHQLRAVRAALGLATALGRAAVLPRLWCGQDRWWAPHAGVIPGSDLQLPFACPADHVLDLEAMEERGRDEGAFGPHIEWRESSFLDNPRAAALAADTLRVAPCDAGSAGCADGRGAPARRGPDGVARVARGLPAEKVAAALAEVAAGVAVLKFDDAAALWTGFADAEREARFRRRLGVYGSLWCCVNAHPGHVWYDLFFDSANGTDRHGRARGPGPWAPATGP
jgi:hypothetical protein